MANVGAPLGNQNSSKNNRLWAETIRRAVVQSDGKRLRQIAEALLDKAAEGDIAAIKELGDRIDGKSVQASDVNLGGKVQFEVNQPWLQQTIQERNGG